jgi:hypothetical protein
LHYPYKKTNQGTYDIRTKEEYWGIEKLIDSEVKRTLRNYPEGYSKIYSLLKTNRDFPRIHSLEISNGIERIILDNLEIKRSLEEKFNN